MSCSRNLIDCFTADPVSSVVGGPIKFTNLSSFIIFAINLVVYVIWGGLIVILLYYLGSSVYKFIFAEDQRTMELFKTTMLKAIGAALGLIVLINIRLIFVMVFKLLGITGAADPYEILPF
jgi:hypothetical protein